MFLRVPLKPHNVAFVDAPREPVGEVQDTPLDVFLHQPAVTADDSSVEVNEVPTFHAEPGGSRWRRFRRWFNHFMFEKDPSQYSSIAPRTPDGRRTKIFFFNGNGRGR